MKENLSDTIVTQAYVDLSSLSVLTTIDCDSNNSVDLNFKAGYDANIAKLIKSLQRTGDTVTIVGKNFIFKASGQIYNSLMKPNPRFGENPSMTMTVRCTEYTLTYGPGVVRGFKIDSLTN